MGHSVGTNPPRVLSGSGKAFLALLASSLGGLAGYMCAVATAALLSEGNDLVLLPAAAGFGLCGGGAVSLFLSKYHLRGSWRDAAAQMRAWFFLVAAAAVVLGGILVAVIRFRQLVLPESASLLTAIILLCIPALGALGAGLISSLVVAARR